jgi:DNA (cytosine-5)-methyltransferase 3A
MHKKIKPKIKVLSLFDGISCAQIALRKAGFEIESYHASEIDADALQITARKFPKTIQIGDVKEVKGKDFKGIDLLIGGSPCQDLSIANNKRKGLKGERSGLFYEYLRILKEAKPKYFVLENVASMSNGSRDEITKLIGVEPIMINAALVSAQNRKRYFWTNIPNMKQPKDKKIILADIIHEARGEKFDVDKYIVKGNHLEWIKDPERLRKKYAQINGEKAITMTARQYASWNGTYLSVRIGSIGKPGQANRIYSIEGKSDALSALGGGRGAKTGLYFIIQKGRGFNKGGIKAKDGKVPTLSSSSWQDNNHLLTKSYVRKLTPIECERLQSLPANHTGGGISDSKRYKALGNAFNANVIAHILKNIPR